MIHWEKTITISAPVEKVFEYLTNPVNLLEVWPNMEEVKNVQSLPNGGTCFHWKFKMAGMPIEGDSDTVEFVPNQHVVTDNTGGVPSHFDWTYRRADGGTELTVRVEYTVPVPLLGKLAEAVVVKINEHDAETLLANLKTRMEG